MLLAFRVVEGNVIVSFIVDPVVDEVELELTPDTTTQHPFDGELAHVPRPGFLFKVLSVRNPTIVSVKVDLFVYSKWALGSPKVALLGWDGFMHTSVLDLCDEEQRVASSLEILLSQYRSYGEGIRSCTEE
ncbi:uncharacterized protein CLUP02_06778 [Colletotrichum lupini]|uniref:Uncharacterized protein n=1 Tax=Colletotrichum lupini TaxID=145971 RepID=A0A9Q8WFV9_9PEZI|nr:uncharacterized protein CLUP02_06778 [Colletotrichum lupini]UQC81292.1 hypothetical protein CLUP02_06778 [Colletotrichum lupini]